MIDVIGKGRTRHPDQQAHDNRQYDHQQLLGKYGRSRDFGPLGHRNIGNPGRVLLLLDAGLLRFPLVQQVVLLLLLHFPHETVVFHLFCGQHQGLGLDMVDALPDVFGVFDEAAEVEPVAVQDLSNLLVIRLPEFVHLLVQRLILGAGTFEKDPDPFPFGQQGTHDSHEFLQDVVLEVLGESADTPGLRQIPLLLVDLRLPVGNLSLRQGQVLAQDLQEFDIGVLLCDDFDDGPVLLELLQIVLDFFRLFEKRSACSV